MEIGSYCVRAVLGFIQCKIAEEISVVSKRASGSAFFHGAEGREKGFVFDGEGLGLLVLFGGSGGVAGGWSGVARVRSRIQSVFDVLYRRYIEGSNRAILT